MQLKLVFTPALLLLMITNSCSQKNSTGNASVVGIFVASTPCGQGTKPLPGISVNEDCEMIKWNLTLYGNESDKTPANYKLRCVYGVLKQGTTDYIGGGKKVEMEGNWTIIKGVGSNPNAIVYRLNDTMTNSTISFLKLKDNLLHLLDRSQRLMIGSAAWSYTLNRIDNK
jgi:hypothetical protein